MNDQSGFYNKSSALDLTTLSNSTLWRKIKDDQFPAPIRISPGRVAWRRDDVHAWLEAIGAQEKEAAE